MKTFRVWVSRRFWPWPKRFDCKGIEWCGEKNGVPVGVLLLVLTDERRVFIDARGRIITYGREVYEEIIRSMEATAGQRLPLE